MTKFIEALEAQIDLERRVRAKPMELMAKPITLTPDFSRIDVLQNRYHLRLVWNVAVWLDIPALDSVIEQARKEAMTELTRLVYGEIYSDLAQLKYMIKYCEDKEKANEIINEIMKKIGMIPTV